MLVVVVFCATTSLASAQVFHTSRHRASARPYATRGIHSGAVTITNSRGRTVGRIPYSPRVLIPGPIYSSRGRSTYSTSRYGVYGVLSGSIRSYSTFPGRTQYSVNAISGLLPHSHIVQPQVHVYGGPLAAPLGYGNTYPTIIAPPIVIPYGGAMTAPNSNTVYPTPGFQPGAIQTFPATPTPVSPPIAPVQPVPVPKQDGGELLSQTIPVDEGLINNEFPASPVIPPKVVAADKIRSLRYQTTGDSSFRSSDYATAEVFYRSATKTAQDRRASWVRLAWAQVSQERFPEAVVSLKKALSLTGEASDWISGDELYGRQLTSNAVLQNEQLWKWLEQRPKSTDRLLLASAFQKMAGRTSTAYELFAEAKKLGLSLTLSNAYQQLSQPDEESAENVLVPVPPVERLEKVDGDAKPLPPADISSDDIIGITPTPNRVPENLNSNDEVIDLRIPGS